MPRPDRANSQRSGASLTRSLRPGPPSACLTPPSEIAPLPTHGVVSRPSFTRASAASSQSPLAARPCSQIQRSACWVPQLWPITPRQPSTATSAAVDRQRAVEARRRRRAEQLRARQRRPVHPRGAGGGTAAARGSRSAAPTRRRRSSPRPGRGASAPRRRRSSRRRRRVGPRQRRLVRSRPVAGRVEQRHPERAVRKRAGPLVDRVADPDAEAAVRMAGLEVEALVVARADGDRGEARLGGVHGGHGRGERTGVLEPRAWPTPQ